MSEKKHVVRSLAAKRIQGKVLMKKVIPERIDLFGGWLSENDAVLLHAPSGVGKSFFAMSIACAIASGGGFGGWHCENPKPVVFCDGEMGEFHLQQMLSRCSEVAGTDANTVGENIILYTDIVGDDDHIDFSCELWRNSFFDSINKGDVIFIDNIRTLFNLEDENCASSWKVVNDFVKRLRKVATVIIVHHDKKTGGFSGSSAAETLVNTRIGLTAASDSNNMEGCGACFRVDFHKVRAEVTCAHDIRVMGLHKKKGWVLQGDSVNEYVEILELAETGKFTTQRELAREIGFSPSKLSKLLKKYDNGEIKKHLEAAGIDGMGILME